MYRDPILTSVQTVGEPPSQWSELGFKFGPKGTHTSRTIMLAELSRLLRQCPSSTPRLGYVKAIVDDNCLGKCTGATRQLSLQRLTELYALDPAVPIFRCLRLFWAADETAHPQLALLAALARDPLLRATAPVVLGMRPGDEIARQQITDALREATEGRLNDSTLDKVVRNAASSWTQSGHFLGRGRKKRATVQPTPASTSFALLLGFLLGVRARSLFETIFCRALDRNADELTTLAMDAKRHGLLDLKNAGGVTVVSFDLVLTEKERRLIYGKS